MKGVKGKFKDEGYMGLLGFEVGVGFGTLPLLVRALSSSAADTPIRACRCFPTAQCDLFRLGEAERGAVQSKATMRARRGLDQVRSRTHATFQMIKNFSC